jgi:hypothetical protein
LTVPSRAEHHTDRLKRAVRAPSISFGLGQGAWGTTVTVSLELDASLPRPAVQLVAGKAIRRLKALAETGEVPTPEHNPSARADAEVSRR